MRLVGDSRRELLPELDVDVLDGVDAEAVDAEVDPGAVDVGHPLDDPRVLGEQVVEADEVAVLARLAGERRVAAVVVVDRVAEPVGVLDVGVGGAWAVLTSSENDGPPVFHLPTFSLVALAVLAVVVLLVPVRATIEQDLRYTRASTGEAAIEWITDDEMRANPQLVKSMSVSPPMGFGRVRLLRVHDVDLQPCGGTHVRNTSEIGAVRVAKVEKKSARTRRVVLEFA